MPEILNIGAMDMLAMSIVVLFFGMYLNRKIRVLADNYIPPAVSGGLLFSVGVALVYAFADLQVEFDMRFRDLLLLVFFSTVGLSARFSTLLAGGKALLILVIAAGVFLFLQNSVGVGIALVSDHHPGYGLLAGSISFAGGHGTAIAWGQVAEEAGFEGAKAIGIAFATFGLITGGLVGGPIARRLISRHKPEIPAPEPVVLAQQGASTQAGDAGDNWLSTVLVTLMLLALCVEFGDLVNRGLANQGIRMPGFLTSMFVGIVLTNSADLLQRPLARVTVERFGEVALNIFLAMSMMAIQLWTLTSAAAVITMVLAAQVLLITIFAIFVIFRVMGRDYDAVVIAAGFAGLGLGATPVAIANMNAITSRYGPSPKAFIIVPLVGAFFIDLLNAGTIQFFIGIIRRFLT